eukprot:CAMPEP_0172618300 /NCGR_PEP_ID=MMETSP1068-20121228/78963_1 /TAXON_ID=35684 /ORGANISM="Pseudopedinella elastica, Strain CCMP716" /LENGTH=155 /DNA_ID=CAMNT_0013424443 /DNA_START=202 /DNA_END=669 /DNA_ORIENTATION=+
MSRFRASFLLLFRASLLTGLATGFLHGRNSGLQSLRHTLLPACGLNRAWRQRECVKLNAETEESKLPKDLDDLLGKADALLATFDEDIRSSNLRELMHVRTNDIAPSGTKPKGKDDSIGFLMEMQKKLGENDYKRIFENPKVRGFRKEGGYFNGD